MSFIRIVGRISVLLVGTSLLSGCNSNHVPRQVQSLLFKLNLRECPVGATLLGVDAKPKLAQWCSLKTKKEDFIKVGKETRWFENGILSQETNYDLDGKKTGQYREWSKVGQLISEGQYTKDQRTGRWVYWNEEGRKIRSETIGEGTLTTIDHSDPNRTIVSTSNSKAKIKCRIEYKRVGENWYPDGEYSECDDSGSHLVSTGLMANGDRQGKWTYFHSNGKIRQVGTYKRGSKIGDWEEYAEDGTTRSHEVFADKIELPLESRSKYFLDKKPAKQRDFFQLECKNKVGERCRHLFALAKAIEPKLLPNAFSSLCELKDDKVEHTPACLYLGKSLFEVSDFAKAAPVLREFCAKPDLVTCMTYGSALFHAGKRDEGLRVVKDYAKKTKLEEGCNGGDSSECYNAACLYSLSAFDGNSTALEKAKTYLRLAVKAGDFDWEWAKIDPDLESLRKNGFLEELRKETEKAPASISEHGGRK